MFNLKCTFCIKDNIIFDGYNNSNNIEIKIIGEQLVEIKCKTCSSTMVVIDGDVL